MSVGHEMGDSQTMAQRQTEYTYTQALLQWLRAFWSD
jgi:hypothetical protein